MSSHHTAVGANSLKHKERYDVITDEEWYILVYRYKTPGGSGKCIGFGLRIETGAERTIEDIFDIIQQVRDTGIHLKSYGPALTRKQRKEHLSVKSDQVGLIKQHPHDNPPYDISENP